MKILELDLQAFGPFSGTRLDLSGGQQGVHVIFGPNEAGKSSALRALRALLYGVPERTQDDFRHGRQDLRVGARLRARGGDELLCYRRKGRKNTLLGADEKPIAEEVLARLLGGTDLLLFERLFGIDHETLVSGGAALLAERGREAEALFSSGLGAVDIQSVLKQLDQEADELFRPRASNPSLNTRLSALSEVEKSQREVSLSARQWDEARKALEAAQATQAELDGALLAASRERSRLERIRRILPNLARRDQLLSQLAALGDLPNLPADFSAKRERAGADRALAMAARSAADGRVAELQQRIQRLPERFDLLEQADLIDALRERLGSHRKAAADRPGLVAERQALIARAETALAQTRPTESLSDALALRPVLNRQRRVTELAGARAEEGSRLREGLRQRDELQQTLEGRKKTLMELGEEQSQTELKRVVEAARRVGDLDRAISDSDLRIQSQTAELDRELARLGLWSGSLDAFRCLPLPAEETLRRFIDTFDALADEERQWREARAEAAAEQDRSSESLRAMELVGSVPTEAELDLTRGHRDQGWELIKRQWIQGLDVSEGVQRFAGTQPLEDVFEAAIGAADEVADRLRRESQRVHERASAQSKLETCERRIQDAELALQALAERRGQQLADWSATWSPCGLQPLAPREMAPWLGKTLRLRERADALGVLQSERERLSDHRLSLQQGLTSALSAFEEAVPGGSLTFAHVLAQAEARLAALSEEAQRRRGLAHDIAELEEREQALTIQVTSLEANAARLAADWARLMGELGLPAETSPGEAADSLKALEQVIGLSDQADQIGARLTAIDADAAAFEAEARTLLEGVAADLAHEPLEQAMVQLGARLTQQRDDRSRLQELQAQLKSAEEEVRAEAAKLKAAEATLAELCRQAGCESPDVLPGIEEEVRERDACLADLAEVDAELVKAGDGLGIEALQAEAASVDRDEVAAELTALEARIDAELRPQQAAALERRLEVERNFNAMAGEDQAAALADEAQHLRAEIRADAERYVRVKLAARILRDEIERFRRDHRDPIIARASHYFGELTCGGFSAVETDFDEADEPVLVGLRIQGERVRVEGMSTGTRDQLYLALRLANLDHHLERAEPLPFIVDDILIQFDDARSKATLAALAEFSAKTQVILFTHHQRVVEQAAELDPKGSRILVHSLQASAAA